MDHASSLLRPAVKRSVTLIERYAAVARDVSHPGAPAVADPMVLTHRLAAVRTRTRPLAS